MKIITVEEHFLNPVLARATADEIERLAPGHRKAFSPEQGLHSSMKFEDLTDLGELRLADMDANGIDMQAHPERFAGFAALPMSNPTASIAELKRCVTLSGLFNLPQLNNTLEMMGAERMLYSVDYPYYPNQGAREFLENAPISASDKEKLPTAMPNGCSSCRRES